MFRQAVIVLEKYQLPFDNFLRLFSASCSYQRPKNKLCLVLDLWFQILSDPVI